MAESLALVYQDLRRARAPVCVRDPEATYVPIPAVKVGQYEYGHGV